jgi:integrase
VADKRFDSATGLWHDEEGGLYVENRWKSDSPLFLRVDREIWQTRHQGLNHTLNWTKFRFSPSMLAASKQLLIRLMRRLSPVYLSAAGKMLDQLDACEVLHTGDLSTLDHGQTHALMLSLKTREQSLFREWYSQWAAHGEAGADPQIARSLSFTKLNTEHSALENVRTWDPHKGALTTSELEVLRQRVDDTTRDATLHEHFARLFLRIVLSLGKRPSQILLIQQDGLVKLGLDEQWAYCLRVPGVKGQTNEKPEDWPISQALVDDIQAYCAQPGVREAQEHYGHLMVKPVRSYSRKDGNLSSGRMGVLIDEWMERHGPQSPRTQQTLQVTPTRLRHTVATQMVRRGYHLDDIRSLLEHKSQNAVMSYVDAVGSDLAPALERVDVKLGGVFSDLQNAFFKGTLTSQSAGMGDVPILVPDENPQPAIVGGCGLGKVCPKNPFFACYDGCPHFLAFREGDHARSLRFFETEEDRWAKAEGGAVHSKVREDFARKARAVQEVIEIIAFDAEAHDSNIGDEPPGHAPSETKEVRHATSDS